MGLFKNNDKETILKELKRRRKSNDRFCSMNDCAPTEYMNGSNRVLDELIDYVEKL